MVERIISCHSGAKLVFWDFRIIQGEEEETGTIFFLFYTIMWVKRREQTSQMKSRVYFNFSENHNYIRPNETYSYQRT